MIYKTVCVLIPMSQLHGVQANPATHAGRDSRRQRRSPPPVNPNNDPKPVCLDPELDTTWKDKDNHTCAAYVYNEWCTPSGGYGNHWNTLDTFEDYRQDGHSAVTACCGCGSGLIVKNADVKFSIEVTCEQGYFLQKTSGELIQSHTFNSFNGMFVDTNGNVDDLVPWKSKCIKKTETKTETVCRSKPNVGMTWDSSKMTCYSYEGFDSKDHSLESCADACLRRSNRKDKLVDLLALWHPSRKDIDEELQAGCAAYSFDANNDPNRQCTLCYTGETGYIPQPWAEERNSTMSTGICYSMESITHVNTKYNFDSDAKVVNAEDAHSCHKACQNDLECRFWSWNKDSCTTSATEGVPEQALGMMGGSCKPRELTCNLPDADVFLEHRKYNCSAGNQGPNCVDATVKCRQTDPSKTFIVHAFWDPNLKYTDTYGFVEHPHVSLQNGRYGHNLTKKNIRTRTNLSFDLVDGVLKPVPDLMDKIGHELPEIRCGQKEPVCYSSKSSNPIPCLKESMFTHKRSNVGEAEVWFVVKDKFYHTEEVSAMCVTSYKMVELVCKKGAMKFKKGNTCGFESKDRLLVDK